MKKLLSLSLLAMVTTARGPGPAVIQYSGHG